MTLHRDETFGPVAAVARFRDTDEVIARANDSEYGLNFSLWTRDTERGRALATRLRAGTVNVNEGYAAAWASVDAPMGGMKASGLGRRHGADGILKYTESQTVAVQRAAPDRAAARRPAGPLGPRDDALAADPQAAAGRALSHGMGEAENETLRVLVADESRAHLEPVGDALRGARPRGDRARRRARRDGAGDPRAPARPRHRRAARGRASTRSS